MILVVDVGNTNINFGVYDKEDMLVMFKLTSKISCTSDEFGLRICCLLDLNKIDRTKIDGAIIASVVPGVMHSLIASIQRYIGCKPLIVGPGIKTGIRVATENPKEMGADRIVDAVAAYDKYGGPVLIVDFGTATTFDIVDKNSRNILESINPDDYPIRQYNSEGINMCRYVLPKNFKDYIR